eukprot:1468493-Prymnesium_polylepis.1
MVVVAARGAVRAGTCSCVLADRTLGDRRLSSLPCGLEHRMKLWRKEFGGESAIPRESSALLVIRHRLKVAVDVVPHLNVVLEDIVSGRLVASARALRHVVVLLLAAAGVAGRA